MKTLCWILQDRSSKSLQRKIDALKTFGFESTLLEASDGDALATSVPVGTEALLLSVRDAKSARDLQSRLRGNAALQFTPIFAVFSGKKDVDMSALVDSGIDDFLRLEAEPEEWALRLALRHRTSEAVQTHAAQMAKSETILKQREEFLSVCAHDLRSPLGLIQSSLSMVINGKEAKALPTMQMELLTRAKRQAGHAITLVNDLLDVMALEQGLKPQYQLLDLHTVLTEFYQDYRTQAEQKQIEFHYVNPISEWRVLADSDRIRQLLQNLFTNALKFTEKGKNIYLTVLPFQGKRKTDPVYPMIVISLKDEGRGIPPNEIQKIFDRFTQLKDSARAEGRGLGLSVAKQISTLHDGNLWVQSEEGRGSTFYVLFPHVISRSKKPEEKPPRPRLVVAEPSASRRDAFYRGWEQDFEVIYARDGVEALTLLFHWMPKAIVLTPSLGKLDENEAANIAKAEALTMEIPLFLALDEGQKPSKKQESMVCDRIVTLPLSTSELKEQLEQIQPTKRKALAKKAA